MTKNKLADLNDHLFAQLERLSEEDLTPKKLEHEAQRSEAMVAVADQILRMVALQVQAAKIAADRGLDPSAYLPVAGVPALPAPSKERPELLPPLRGRPPVKGEWPLRVRLR